jgi:hypothetical protein
MASPTRSLSSPTTSRIRSNIPETNVLSPRSISSRNELEMSIHSLQSKISMIDSSTHLFSFLRKKKTLKTFVLYL